MSLVFFFFRLVTCFWLVSNDDNDRGVGGVGFRCVVVFLFGV